MVANILYSKFIVNNNKPEAILTIMIPYLLNKHKEKLIQVLEDEDSSKHFGFTLLFVEICDVDPNLGNSILRNPEGGLLTCDNFIISAQEVFISEIDNKLYSVKKNVHARVFGLPTCPELHRTDLPKPLDLGNFLQLSGLIVKTASMKMLEYKRDYECIKCKYNMTINADHDMNYSIKPPKFCKNPETCKGIKFKVVSTLDSNHCKDYQEIKMQEEGKAVSNNMWLILENDLVDVCKPGDTVTVCGIVKNRFKKICVPGTPNLLEMTLLVNHLQVNNDVGPLTVSTIELKQQFESFWYKYRLYPLYGRDLILRSFCPQIYGMYMAKLAMVIVLAGGSTFDDEGDSNVRTRTEPHLLLVGDPGTGKSELLRFATTIIPRSVLVTGVTSTSAGLTAAAVQENGEWHLEAGALIFADGGICCIDEFNSMKENDRNSLLEAMEQQTVSVAKASIVTKLNTRCSILAAMNHKTSSDNLTKSLGLSSPLISRFDLILTVKDQRNDDWDERVVDYIMSGCKYRSKFFDDKNNKWSLEMLQAYFSLIKSINPKLSDAANTVLGAYYQLQRNNSIRSKSRTTIRLLDSLVRLSQAHARLLQHKTVLIMDAVVVISLIEYGIGEDENSMGLDTEYFKDYPVDPTESYKIICDAILTKLNLLGIQDDSDNCDTLPEVEERLLKRKLDCFNSVERTVGERSSTKLKSSEDTNAVRKSDLLKNIYDESEPGNILKTILEKSKIQATKRPLDKVKSFASCSSFSSESIFDNDEHEVDFDL